jgi:hypothetical protein
MDAVGRQGTEPATAATGDAAWREACRSQYLTWNEADGTVVRRGSPEPVRCPLILRDGVWGIPE